MTNKKFRFESPFVVFSILVVGVLLRIYLIYLRKYPTVDEIWAYLLTKADLNNIWLATLGDFHGPFYFIFLRILVYIVPFELSIFLIRVIALLFGIAGCYAIWYLASKLLEKRAALVTFYLSLLSPGLIWTAIYGRYYSFLVLLVTVSLIIFLDFLKTKRTRDLIILVFISTIGIYTHYYFFLIDLVFFLYLLSFDKYRFLLKKWLLAIFSIVVICLPLLFFLLTLPKPEINGRGYNNLLKIPSVLVTNLTSFETFIYLYFQGKPIYYVPVIVALWVTTAILLVYVFITWKSKLKMLFFYLFLVPPFILAIVSYSFKPFFALASLQIFSTSTLIFLGKGIDSQMKYVKVVSTIFALSLFFSLIFLFQSSYTYAFFGRDFQFVTDNFEEGDIIVNAHFSSFLMSTYYFGSGVTYGVIDNKTATAITQNALSYKIITSEMLGNVNGRIWYLEPYHLGPDEAKAIKQTLDNNFRLVKQEIFVPEKKYKENFTFFNVYLYTKNEIGD